MTNNDELYMEQAIIEAKKAYEKGEVPIGAVIVRNDEIIARGYNLRNTNKSPLSHAEISAIAQAADIAGDWRLEDCVMYVTVEPCPMCAGAILQARLPRLVFGTRNAKAGCCGSILNILQDPRFNHQAEITEGVLKEQCSRLMSSFFTRFRKRSKD